ncbi:F-box/WD repeat-containing protein 5 [Desmophyllum pertusum]|uniref:F-box/WD repeat-containing protein 5 n=1 Tax=Desmophyllum pertusum TaxID=174260 RepID=A0A9X0CMI5_9CNID|nr:F-box/WD repeat-containing protein 5 [Desmophyllum pertusum]
MAHQSLNCGQTASMKNYKIKTNLTRVVNRNASSVRTVLVARPNNALQCANPSAELQQDDHVCLIFTHGTVTYVPHQIVFKWLRLPHGSNCHGGLSDTAMKQFCLDNGHKQSTEMPAGGGCESSTKPDHCIETNAHIIGMSLSPDHQYLYVNCRMWEQHDGKVGCELAESPPEISNDITLQVYSLSTYELVSVHVGHKAFTANNGCFFIFLNVADNLVASGAEDHCAHVWDRHFGAKLATLKGHSSVVNCVAFNPVNQEMVVSASDDHTIRVWRSRYLSKLNDKANLKKNVMEKSALLTKECAEKQLCDPEKIQDNSVALQATRKKRRKRTIFTCEQLSRLESEFADQQYMVGAERQQLAEALNLSEDTG